MFALNIFYRHVFCFFLVILYRLCKIKNHNQIVRKKLKQITEKTMSVEEKATNLEDMLREEERGVKVKFSFSF